MSVQAVKDVAVRAIQDEDFRAALQANPEETLAGYDLTEQERVALMTLQFGAVEDLLVDSRFNKSCLINRT
jgi:hypothetical protein